MTTELPGQPPDREAIRSELEATRQAYHDLLGEIPQDALEAPTANPAWNVRQVLYHITMAVRMTPQDIKMIRSRRFFAPPAWLFNLLNDWITRWGARQQTAASLAQAYDQAHSTLMALVDDLSDDELQLSGHYPNVGGEMTGGDRTIADIIHFLTLHFVEHESDVRQALSGLREQTA